METENIWKGLLALLLVFLLATTIVHAEDEETEIEETEDAETINMQALNVRFDHLKCKVDLTNRQIDLIKEVFPDADLTEHKDKLNADIDELSSIKDLGEKAAFDEYITTVLRPDFHEANSDIREIKANWSQYNNSDDQAAEFRDGIKAAVESYAECVGKKEKAMTRVMMNHLKYTETHWNRIIGTMQNRNMDTAKMEQIKEQLQARIAEIQQTISYNDTTRVRQRLDDAREHNLQLWANFERERLYGYLDKIEGATTNANRTNNIESVKSRLENIDRYVVQGYAYQRGDAVQVRAILGEASKELRQTSLEIAKERRQAANNAVDIPTTQGGR